MISITNANQVGDNDMNFLLPGAIAFIRSVSLETVRLGVHLAAEAHDILLQAEYILTNVPPSVPVSVASRATANVRTNQPKDVQQGIQQVFISYALNLLQFSLCTDVKTI